MIPTSVNSTPTHTLTSAQLEAPHMIMADHCTHSSMGISTPKVHKQVTHFMTSFITFIIHQLLKCCVITVMLHALTIHQLIQELLHQ